MLQELNGLEALVENGAIVMDHPKRKHLVAFYKGERHLLKKDKKTLDMLKKYGHWKRFKGGVTYYVVPSLYLNEFGL